MSSLGQKITRQAQRLDVAIGQVGADVSEKLDGYTGNVVDVVHSRRACGRDREAVGGLVKQPPAPSGDQQPHSDPLPLELGPRFGPCRSSVRF